MNERTDLILMTNTQRRKYSDWCMAMATKCRGQVAENLRRAARIALNQEGFYA